MKTIAYFSPWRHRSSRAGPLIAHIDTSNANWRRVQIVSHEERWTLTFFVTETVSEVFDVETGALCSLLLIRGSKGQQ